MDGTKPESWKNSNQIFSQYLSSEDSVKYGQCWVFAGIVTSLARGCGIPARPVTNFYSGHDADGDGIIKIYYNRNGIINRNLTKDSYWNFHVWTEMWMSRPDVESGDGWQIVDGTPQELSDGRFQCGPASRNRVKSKSGGIYDTAFVQASVSAPLKCYRVFIWGLKIPKRPDIEEIGVHITTKKKNAWEHLDITDDYE